MFECPPWNRGCDNCLWYDPDDKKIEDCKHADLENNNAGFTMNCKAWKPKKEPDKEQADDKPTCSLNPDPHGSCWTCPIDCQRWKDMVQELLSPNKKPLDVFLNTKKRETIGATVINPDGITKLHLNENKQAASDKVTMKKVEDKLDKERQARIQAIALDRGVQQGHTLEALDTVFDIACQQVPSCKERWMILKEHIQGMLINKWSKENEDCFRAEY